MTNEQKRYLIKCGKCGHSFYWFEDNPHHCPKCGSGVGIYKGQHIGLDPKITQDDS